MIILGVDPGIQNTGFAVLLAEEQSCQMLEFGLFKTSNTQSFEIRLKKIYDQLCEIVSKYRFDALALEEVFYSHNIQVALKIGHARGVTLLAAANYQIPIAEYSAKEVKLAATGNGNASKHQVQQMISRLLNLPTTPSDFNITDAMAVAYCHSQRMISKIQI